MAVSKKLRFEVFKRDGFICQYCGKTPPSAILEADHIKPKSKNGKDDINNLITSCFDCNRGKGAIELKRIPPTLQENMDVIKEKEDQLKEYLKAVAKFEKAKNKLYAKVGDIYSSNFPDYTLSETFKNSSLKKFIDKLQLEAVVEAMAIACEKMEHQPDDAIRYFCGICWRKIRDNEEDE